MHLNGFTGVLDTGMINHSKKTHEKPVRSFKSILDTGRKDIMDIKMMLHEVRDKRKQYKAAEVLVDNNMRYINDLKKDRVTQDTIDRAMAQLEEAIDARDVVRNECATLETNLADAINKLEDIRERNVMYAMYVVRLDARAIAKQMHYCQSFIWQCRKSAIDRLNKM